ncbi:MAG: hypothetical protein GY847_10775 [Proteobacteria bacterium]|nr:hypothetical protein [Pseudomonadota bacterium]
MTSQNKLMNDMLNMARSSFDAGANVMDTFEKQAEKAIDLSVSNTDLAQEETRKAFDGWLDNTKKARKIYTDSIEECFTTLEQQFSSKTPKGNK